MTGHKGRSGPTSVKVETLQVAWGSWTGNLMGANTGKTKFSICAGTLFLELADARIRDGTARSHKVLIKDTY